MIFKHSALKKVLKSNVEWKFFGSNLNVGFGCVAYSWLVLDDLSDDCYEMFKAVNTEEMKRSPITAKKTQTKAIKSLSMGSPCFLTWTEHQIFTSSLEPLLGNWIAKESYLGGKSSQFLIDLNSNCHSRREQFTIDRLQSKKSKFSKTSSNSSSWWHFIWIPLLFEKETFFKEANLRWKLFEYLRWVWEGRSERRKKVFGLLKFMSNAIIATLRMLLE